jgi:hypothetical protein
VNKFLNDLSLPDSMLFKNIFNFIEKEEVDTHEDINERKIDFQIYNDRYYLINGSYQDVMFFVRKNNLRLASLSESADFMLVNYDGNNSPEHIKKPFFTGSDIIIFPSSFYLMTGDDLISSREDILYSAEKLGRENLELSRLIGKHDSLDVILNKYKRNLKIPADVKEMTFLKEEYSNQTNNPGNQIFLKEDFEKILGKDGSRGIIHILNELGEKSLKINFNNPDIHKDSCPVVEKIIFGGLDYRFTLSSSYKLLSQPDQRFLAVEKYYK